MSDALPSGDLDRPLTDHEKEAAACDWADYRKQYGVSADELNSAHKAFLAGWKVAHLAQLREISLLRAERDESRWPALDKMSRDATAECMKQWNRADALQARIDAAMEIAGVQIRLALTGDESHAPERFDLVAHLARQRYWSDQTFGPGDRALGVVDHIRKELAEIEAAPGDLTEWIDVVILAFDGAGRSGATPEQIVAELVAKQSRNEARVWPDWRSADPDKAIEHDRSAG